jgi:RNA polymerase sigma-70 factor (ECF subfamily)
MLHELSGGNITALLPIYEKYKHPLYLFCFRILKDGQNAEDAVQETFSTLVNYSHRIRSGAALKSWLYAVARNECLVCLKRSSKRDSINDDSPFETDDLVAIIEQKDLSAKIHQAIDLLKIEYREVVLLREFGQLSYEEIAQITDCSVGTIKMKLFRARKELAKLLKPLVGKENL